MLLSLQLGRRCWCRRRLRAGTLSARSRNGFALGAPRTISAERPQTISSLRGRPKQTLSELHTRCCWERNAAFPCDLCVLSRHLVPSTNGEEDKRVPVTVKAIDVVTPVSVKQQKVVFDIDRDFLFGLQLFKWCFLIICGPIIELSTFEVTEGFDHRGSDIIAITMKLPRVIFIYIHRCEDKAIAQSLLASDLSATSSTAW